MSKPNTRIQVDFKDDAAVMKGILSRAKTNRQSAGKQLLIEYLAAQKKGAK